VGAFRSLLYRPAEAAEEGDDGQIASG
jgi:hypothetical protein